MKQLVIVLFIFSLSSLLVKSLAQVKNRPALETTINWIVEKLNANSKLSMQSSGVVSIWDEDYSFKYDPASQALVATHTHKDNDNVSQRTYKVITEIPLNRISQIVKADEDNLRNCFPLFLDTDGNFIKESKFYSNGKLESVDNKSSFYIPFDYFSEKDIYKRMVRAFADLRANFPRKTEAY